ncbi:MAG: hypothetical protein R3C03_23665 [Pirellulaceae bacterium]
MIHFPLTAGDEGQAFRKVLVAAAFAAATYFLFEAIEVWPKAISPCVSARLSTQIDDVMNLLPGVKKHRSLAVAFHLK